MTTSPSTPATLRSRRTKTWSSLRLAWAQAERVRDRDPRHEPHRGRDATGDGARRAWQSLAARAPRRHRIEAPPGSTPFAILTG